MVTLDKHGKHAVGVWKKYVKIKTLNVNKILDGKSHSHMLFFARIHDYSCVSDPAGPACHSTLLFWVMSLTHSWLWIETSRCHWHPTYLPLTKHPNGPSWRRLPFNNRQRFLHSHNCLSSALWHCYCSCHRQYLFYLPLREAGANVLLCLSQWYGETQRRVASFTNQGEAFYIGEWSKANDQCWKMLDI